MGKPEDIVEQLDKWLSEVKGNRVTRPVSDIRRVRDEILQLRDGLLAEYGSRLIQATRDETIEEAAKAAVEAIDLWRESGDEDREIAGRIVGRIRALRDKDSNIKV